MPTKIVHVCVASNGAENVMQAVEGLGTSRFMLLHDDLSLGPLRALNTEAGRQARFAYLLETNATDDDPDWRKYLAQFENRMGLVDLFPPPAPDESALVWFGDMANEQLLLRAVCASWPDTDIYLADVRRIAHKYKAHKNYVPCFPPEVLRELVSLAEPLPMDCRHALAHEWQELTQQDDLLRIYECDRIVGIPDDFFDEDLLAACKPCFQIQGAIAGEVQSEGKHVQGDMYLFYRLQGMADRGLVEIEPCPGDIRSSLVRRL